MALSVSAKKQINFAHLVTSVRLVLTPIFLSAINASAQQPDVWSVSWVVALFFIICASDYYDGPIARALELSSDVGKVFDNLADITFLLVSLSYLVHCDAVPWWIPVAIALAFGQYTADSWLLSGKGSSVTLVSNFVGHWAGILNYIFTGICALYVACQQQFPPALLYHGMLAFWSAYIFLAMSMRLRFFLIARRAIS